MIGGTGQSVGPDLTHSQAVRHPIELATAMWNHGSIMEQWVRERNLPWPTLTGNDVADLQTYLLAFQASSPAR